MNNFLTWAERIRVYPAIKTQHPSRILLKELPELRKNKTQNIKELIEDYLRYIKKNERKAERTVEERMYILKRFRKWLESYEIQLVEEVDIYRVEDYFAMRSDQVKKSSSNMDRQAIRSFFEYCLHYRKLNVQFYPESIKYLRIKQPKIRIYTHEQISAVISQVRVKQDGLMIAVLYETAMRISELSHLKVGDINNRAISIQGKNEECRVVFMTEGLASQLQTFLKQQRRTEGYVFRQMQHHWNNREFFTSDRIRERLKREFRKAGFDDWHPHLLRHSLAVHMLQAGMDIRSIQKLLGHKDIKTTMRYLHITDKHLEDDYHARFQKTVYTSVLTKA